MSRRALLSLLTILFCMLSAAAVCQSALSANSSINGADTYVVVDLTITNNTNITLPSPAYNPVTKTSSSTLTVGPPTQTFHVEAGYDSGGGLVMNFWPTGAVVDPINSDGNPCDNLGGRISVGNDRDRDFQHWVRQRNHRSADGVGTGWPDELYAFPDFGHCFWRCNQHSFYDQRRGNELFSFHFLQLRHYGLLVPGFHGSSLGHAIDWRNRLKDASQDS
jgi:hypothetical protein